MTQKFEKLKQLLMELFQLDEPELDFGLYRIMHAKSAEVTTFLENELLPQVRAAFVEFRPADKAALKLELEKVIEQARALGADPEALPKVKELKTRLASTAVDIDALEGEVFDHLYDFFRRYYHEGDFLSRRVYKPGVYAIPYEGEEVHLHWANKDQYYIKSSEYLRDYAFRLRPHDTKNPMRVHFRIVDATEGEHGNVKAAEGKERAFVLAPEPFAEVVDGELSLRFEYRPARMEDWPEAERDGKAKPPKRDDLLELAERSLFGLTDKSMLPWIEELQRLAPTEKQPKRTVLAKHLDKYTKAHKFDYFIHKDLGGFLRRELDFFIKNEVMHLDDIEKDTAPKVEQYLSKIRVLRKIAGKLIDFLAQLEDFQKKLWLKKKFVVETSWCVSLGVIPKEFYVEIAANDAQREGWVRLCAIDEIKGDLATPGYSVPLTPAFLAAQASLLVDTRHFSAECTARLLQSLVGLETRSDGVLVHSENAQALGFMRTRLREQAKLVFTDPPYNTGADGFPYKDAYLHSSWSTMMWERLEAARQLLGRDGVLAHHIDENERAVAAILLAGVFGPDNLAGEVIWKNSSKNDQAYVSMQHEHVLFVVKDKAVNLGNWTERKDGLDEIYAAFKGFRAKHGDDWAAIHEAALEWYKSFPESNPIVDSRHYSWMDEDGPYFPADISGPNYGQYRYDVPHPVTGLPCKEPASGWRFPRETMSDRISKGLIHFGPDETTVPHNKTHLQDTERQSLTSVKYKDGRVASKLLFGMFGEKLFTNPKDVGLTTRLFRALETDNALIVDYFAGSGTTGHAIISMNREEGGRRKFFLVEMADYFDTVLLPRLKKVAFTPEWKDGKPARMATKEECDRGPRIIQVLRLESYEDALNNLAPHRTKEQDETLFSREADGADGFREDYLLRYMLDVETRDNASLLNVRAFHDPTNYKLVVKRPGSDESREVTVDLIETFNWLIGLVVEQYNAPKTFRAEFERNAHGRLVVKDRLVPDAKGPWWFRTVTGTLRSGEKVLVIWRKRPGGETVEGMEQDNLVLDEWLRKEAYSTRDLEFDLIYVNGDNNLPNVRREDTEQWKVRLIEEDFHRLMFEGTES